MAKNAKNKNKGKNKNKVVEEFEMVDSDSIVEEDQTIVEKSKAETKKVDKKKKESNTKKKTDTDSSFDSELTRIITVAAVILIIFCVFYWITFFITHKDDVKDDNNEVDEVNISYERILLGRSFSMPDSEYYVLYYDITDEDISSTYSSLVSTYRGKTDVSPLYVVNMGDAMNSPYASDSGNREATGASELKISGPTLIKFVDGGISEYIEGEESITSTLN